MLNRIPLSGFAFWSSAAKIPQRAEEAGKAILLLSVQDSGCGFSLEVGERLFEPFYTTNAQGIGTGLGISRAIVRAHGALVGDGGSGVKLHARFLSGPYLRASPKELSAASAHLQSIRRTLLRKLVLI